MNKHFWKQFILAIFLALIPLILVVGWAVVKAAPFTPLSYGHLLWAGTSQQGWSIVVGYRQENSQDYFDVNIYEPSVGYSTQSYILDGHPSQVIITACNRAMTIAYAVFYDGGVSQIYFIPLEFKTSFACGNNSAVLLPLLIK